MSEYAMMGGGEEGLEECVGLQRIHRICIMSTIPYHSHTTTIPYHSHITTIPYHSQFPYSNHTIPFPHKQCYAYDSVPALPHSDHTLYLIPLIFPCHVYHDDTLMTTKDTYVLHVCKLPLKCLAYPSRVVSDSVCVCICI